MTPPSQKTPNPRATATSRRLRRDSTGPEQALWHIVRNRRLGGFKFRRQYAIEPYIVDFYCDEAKLAVELDGMSHVGTGDVDDARTAFIESQGIRVVRFTNDDVLKHRDAVAEALVRAVQGATVTGEELGAPSPGRPRKGRPTSPGGRGGA